jgi:conjugative relaxase-like TrwC/TraI family protein
MLTISKISSDGSGYYGKDNYYTKGEQEAGTWFGKGAKIYGLEGNAVDDKKFDEFMNGKFGDIQLGKNNHHPGWDLTFSAPKSVSILALVARDERLIEAHDTAVSKALSYVENNLAESRFRMSGLIESRKTGNIIAARFRHDISRDKDPQLHTHAAVLNVTFGNNNVLRSLDSPVFYENKMLLGAIYQSELAQAVQKIGYKIKILENGTFQIIGVSKEILEQASKRRDAIVALQKEQGTTGNAIAANAAALETRGKKETLSYKQKQALWKEDFGEKAINSLVNFKEKQTVEEKTKSQIADDRIEQTKVANKAVSAAIKHLSENESVFKRIDLAREAIVMSLGKTTVNDIQQAIKLKEKEKVLLQAQTKETKILNGKKQIIIKKAFTTPKAVAQEKLTLKIMREERVNAQPITNKKNLKLARSEVFTPGQSAAAREILTTRDRFTNIQGFAGTGKSFMLAEVAEQAKANGVKVIGMAPSNSAASNLKRELNIEIKTIQKHLIEGLVALRNPSREKTQREIWLIDEASLIDTKQALALTKLATKNDAQVVLLGDKYQLASVGAGKPFAISQNKKYGINTVKMTDIIRQTDKILIQAVYAATKGNIKRSFAQLDKSIIEVKDREGKDEPVLRRQIIADSYLSMSTENRAKTLVISPANEDRLDINQYIRNGLEKENTLQGKNLETTNLVNKHLTNEARKQAYNYQEDNIVRFNRAYKSLGIKKNDYAKVTKIDERKNEISLQIRKGKTITWNPEKQGGKNTEVYYENARKLKVGEVLFWRRSSEKRNTNEKIKILDINHRKNKISFVDLITGEENSMKVNEFNNKHFEYAYCQTAHQSQGQTSDKVLINLESWRGKLSNQQAFYVEISRAKEEAIIFTDDIVKLERQLTTHEGEKQSALEQVQNLNAPTPEHLAQKIAQEQNEKRELQEKTEKWMQSLSKESLKSLEKSYRETQRRTMLKIFDDAPVGSRMKNVYEKQIEHHAQKIVSDKEKTKDQDTQKIEENSKENSKENATKSKSNNQKEK